MNALILSYLSAIFIWLSSLFEFEITFLNQISRKTDHYIYTAFLKAKTIFQVILKFTSKYYCNFRVSVLMIIHSKTQFYKMWDISVTLHFNKAQRSSCWELNSRVGNNYLSFQGFLFSSLPSSLFFVCFFLYGMCVQGVD